MTAISTIQVVPFPTEKADGYNLSVCEFHGSTYHAYRWHPKKDSWRTEIQIVKDGKEFELIVPHHYKNHSIEDPRFFVFNDQLCLSATIARSRVSGQSLDPCIVGYGALHFSDVGVYLQKWIEPKHAKNNWSNQTKNLVFRESSAVNGLTMTWETYPNHVVHLLDAQGNLVTGWRTESPKCPFGTYRGGTQSFAFDGKRLRFCHAVQNNPKATLYWGYSLAAYVFDPEPPFRIVAVSQQPILRGNEAYTPDVPHWKPRICICYGAVADGDGWKVSCGFNDCSCAIVKVRPCDLNL